MLMRTCNHTFFVSEIVGSVPKVTPKVVIDSFFTLHHLSPTIAVAVNDNHSGCLVLKA